MSQPNVGKPALAGSASAVMAARPPAAITHRGDAWLRRLPLLPALVYVFLITQVPFALTVYYSLFSWNLLRPGSFRFAGLRNYADVLGDPATRIAIANTVGTAAVATAARRHLNHKNSQGRIAPSNATTGSAHMHQNTAHRTSSC